MVVNFVMLSERVGWFRLCARVGIVRARLCVALRVVLV